MSSTGSIAAFDLRHELGDRIFTFWKEKFTRGEIVRFPPTPNEDEPVITSTSNNPLDFRPFYDKNSNYYKLGRFTKDGIMYAFGESFPEYHGFFDYVCYVIRIIVDGISKNVLVKSHRLIKREIPLFKPGDKIIFGDNFVKNHSLGDKMGEIVYFLPTDYNGRYAEYYDTNNPKHQYGEFSEDGQMYAIHNVPNMGQGDIADNMIYNVCQRGSENNTYRQKDLIKHLAYNVLTRPVHDFLSRNKTNRMKTLDDKAYLPDEMKDHIIFCKFTAIM